MNEPVRDPALARALRALSPADADAPVDWDALHGRIAAAAELPLARRRRRASAGRRLRAAAPLAAAAALAGIALATLPARAPAPLPAEEQAVVEEILELSVPDQVGLLLSGQAAEAALLDAVEGEG